MRNLQVEIGADASQLIRSLEHIKLHMLWVQLGYWLRARRFTA